MNLQKDFLLGFLSPLVFSFLLMLLARPWRRDDRLLWLIPLSIGLVYPIALWLRLGNHIWPMRDSLDRLIVIVPSMCGVISLLMLAKSKSGSGILCAMLIGALFVLGIRKTNAWDYGTFALWMACIVTIASAVSIGVARFVRRDDSLLMPILIACSTLAITGYVSATGSITLGQSALPFCATMIALLAVSIVCRRSVFTPTLVCGLVMIISIFLASSLWWTSSWEWAELIESILLLAVPLLAWLRFAPQARDWKQVSRAILILTLATILSAAIVGRKQWVMLKSLAESESYYDL